MRQPSALSFASSPVLGQRNFWLEACRSLAIIGVLLSHGRHFLVPVWNQATVLRVGGFLGVELFFVLSGFLIGNIIWSHFKAASGHSWVPEFLARRWLRTLPNYYLFLLVNALLIAYAIVPGRVADLLAFTLFTQNLAWPHPVVFSEAWSLAVEEVFYLILPLFLVLLSRLISDRKAAFLWATTLLLLFPFAARIVAVSMAEPLWDEGIRKVVVFRLDALAVGVLANWLLRELLPRGVFRKVPLLASATMILGGAIVVFFLAGAALDTSVFTRILLFPMVSIGCALVIAAGLTWRKAPAVIGTPVAVCARWSYALYLAHMPVFHLITWSLGDSQPAGAPEAFLRWTLFIAGSVLVAALVERYFERPILQWRDRVVPGHRQATAA